jgi:hypothetical protein
VDLKPAVVTAELASAALASPALSRALRLAGWVGDGREITQSGVLRPAAAAQACAALGIDLPSGKTPRSARDVPELDRDWEVARAAGLISVHAKHAQGPGLHDVTDDPAATLDAWLSGVAAPFGLPDDLCADCLTVVGLIADDADTIVVNDLLRDVDSMFPAEAEPCPDCAEVHPVEDDEGHSLFAVANLVSFGALALVDDDRLTLTPLGRMLVSSVFAALAPASEDSASAVVTRLGMLPAGTATLYARDWLAARTPVDAARELFDFAAVAAPFPRSSAFALAAAIGPQAAPAWRERAEVPGYGAYVRIWLAEQGEDVPFFPLDEVWLVAESLGALVDQVPPEFALLALTDAFAALGADNLLEAIARLGESGHPDAPRFIEKIRAVAPGSRTRSAGPAARSWPALARDEQAPYQLMITLRGVGEPSVWRRVAVSGSATLGDVHDVIQAAMGWENAHPYAFEADHRELPGGMELSAALPRRGSRIQYKYDFGDDWEHDIEFEGFFYNEQGVTLPACLDGEGACPPEDSGGAGSYEYMKADVLPNENHEEHEEMLEWLGLESGDDFDPAAFSLGEANERLACLRPRAVSGPGLANA